MTTITHSNVERKEDNLGIIKTVLIDPNLTFIDAISEEMASKYLKGGYQEIRLGMSKLLAKNPFFMANSL